MLCAVCCVCYVCCCKPSITDSKVRRGEESPVHNTHYTLCCCAVVLTCTNTTPSSVPSFHCSSPFVDLKINRFLTTNFQFPSKTKFQKTSSMTSSPPKRPRVTMTVMPFSRLNAKPWKTMERSISGKFGHGTGTMI